MAAGEWDLIVIGAGPGGYVASIRAAQLGWRVACIDREAAPGGTCLRIGCIPSKALLESSELYHRIHRGLGEHGIGTGKVTLDVAALMQRKSEVVDTLTSGVTGLLKKNGVTLLRGTARLLGAGKVHLQTAEGKEELRARHILLATGSVPASLPGIELDGKVVVTSTEALSFSRVPSRLVVIGAGYIGLELGTVWARLGAQVTVLEYLPRILPGMDEETAREAQKVFSAQGLEFRLGARVTAVRRQGRGASVEVEQSEPLRADRVLVAVGRIPATKELGLEEAGITTDERGRVVVDEDYQTSEPGVFAIGDCIPGPMLAHKAEEEGVACVEKLITGYGHVNYGVIPGVVYTDPEVATVGASEEELKTAGIEYRKGVFPFRANGRARSLAMTDGKVKILAEAATDRILGVHIIGPRAGDLIAEAVAAMEFGASSEDLARTCHAHPTLAEALKEAALAVEKRAVHI